MCRKRATGFTLIELSIVLVVISLVTGGVLTGRELIYTSSIRSTASQAEQYATAYNAFKLKYQCLPGDCAKATNFGLPSVAFLGNGNGDGFILICCNPPDVYSREAINVFPQLAAAGLINDFLIPQVTINSYLAGVVSPRAKMRLVDENAGWTLNSVTAYTGNITVLMLQYYSIDASGAVDPTDAYSLDIKFDDGKPLSGKLQHTSQAYYNTYLDRDLTMAEVVSAGARGCVMPDGSGYAYNISAPDNLVPAEACRLWIQIN